MNRSASMGLVAVSVLWLSACGGGGGGGGASTPPVTEAVPAGAATDSTVAIQYLSDLTAVAPATSDTLEPVATVPDALATDDTAEPKVIE